MSTPTRDERRQRIAADDGDPDDEMVIAVSDTTGVCYHSGRSCWTIPVNADVETIGREQAQQNGKAPCRVCVLDDIDLDGQKTSAVLEALDPEDLGLSPLRDDTPPTTTPNETD